MLLVRQAATGLGISGLNPKVLLLFLALLPQLTDPEAPVAARGADHGTRTGARGQLCPRLHGGGAGGPAGVADTTYRSAGSHPFLGAAMVVIGAVLVVDQLLG